MAEVRCVGAHVTRDCFFLDSESMIYVESFLPEPITKMQKLLRRS